MHFCECAVSCTDVIRELKFEELKVYKGVKERLEVPAKRMNTIRLKRVVDLEGRCRARKYIGRSRSGAAGYKELTSDDPKL
jgi:hypothetical protein